MSAVSALHPAAGYTVKGVQAVYGLSIRREVLFPAGVDLQRSSDIHRPHDVGIGIEWEGGEQLELVYEPDRKASEGIAGEPLQFKNAAS